MSDVRCRMLKGTQLFLSSVLCLLFLTSCGPTYPKDRLKESIIKICKTEYTLDVKVRAVGKTLAIYFPLEDLMDFNFAVTEAAKDKISNVILSVTRVVLSTDANFDFYCIIAHDVRIPEIQVMIIENVNDVKRVLLNDISRGEFFKRILIDLRLNPQSQKERSIKEVFQKMNLDSRWQEQVLNDFFRSEPAIVGDMGYWNGRFYIKDISLDEFLAEQMASRIRIDFKEDGKLSETFLLKSAKGAISCAAGVRYFKLEVLAQPKFYKESELETLSNEVFRTVVNIAAHVMHAYGFERFDYVEVTNQFDGRVIRISKDDLEKLRTKKMKFEEIAR